MSKNTTIELASGRLIHLCELNQSFTYKGLILGVPTHKINQAFIARALEQAGKGREGTPYIIEPTEKPFEGDWHLDSDSGPAVALPSVKCVGLFESGTGPQGSTLEESWLLIVWFQDEFALPIQPEILEQIKAVDWDRVAIEDGGL
jgi:hypothetical protein